MQKDFITATPDSGGSGSTTVTATAPANQTESARSVNLSVAGGVIPICGVHCKSPFIGSS